MDPQQQRFRLGLFVLAAVMLLAVLIVMFGRSPRLFTARNTYTIVFADAPGVSVGTPVRRSGVKIGEVTKVELDDTTGEVRVQIAVDSKYTLRTTDQAVINQDLLSRDTTVDFVPQRRTPTPASKAGVAPKGEVRQVGALPDDLLAAGQPPLGKQPPEQKPAPGQPAPPPAVPPVLPPGEPIPPGAVIRGRSPASAEDFFGRASELLPTLQQTLSSIRRTAERLEPVVPELEAGAREFAGVGRSFREAIPELRRTNDELRLLIQSARTLGPALRQTNEEFQVTLRNIGSVAEQLDNLVRLNQDKIVRALDQTTDVLQRVSQVLSDENQKNFTATLRALQQASANFDAVVRDSDQFLKEGTKTAQRFQQTLNQTDQVLTNLNQATKPLADRGERVLRNIDASAEQLNRILAGVSEALGPISGGGGTVQKFFTDPSLYNNLNAAACMVTRVLPRVDNILRDVEVFADKIARHPESIGLGGAVRPSAGLKDAPTNPYPTYRQPRP